MEMGFDELVAHLACCRNLSILLCYQSSLIQLQLNFSVGNFFKLTLFSNAFFYYTDRANRMFIANIVDRLI